MEKFEIIEQSNKYISQLLKYEETPDWWRGQITLAENAVIDAQKKIDWLIDSFKELEEWAAESFHHVRKDVLLEKLKQIRDESI